MLSLPTPQVLNTVLETWRRDRKPANVELVLDNSGSMADEDKLEHAKQGLQAFFKQVAPQDEIGLAKFSAGVTPLVAPAPYRENKAQLNQAVKDIIPEDDTAIYDALVYGVDAVKKRADADHINAVVVLTDGEDTHSSNSRASALARLKQEGESESGGVRVFTIAYGRDAHESELSSVRDGLGRQGLQGLHRRHRGGLPLDLQLLLSKTPVTRDALKRQLAVNAATKPLNIAAPAAVIVVGLLLGVTAVALPVAIVAYIALFLQTFFDGGEAEKVGKAAYGDAA